MCTYRMVLFHNLDRVLRRNDQEDPDVRKEPNAINKLEKGDASLNTSKRALGWDLDGKNRLLKVPPHRVERAAATLKTLASQSRAGHTTWQSMLGDLRNLTPGIPGGRGQFSLLQAALTAANKKERGGEERRGIIRLAIPVIQYHESATLYHSDSTTNGSVCHYFRIDVCIWYVHPSPKKKKTMFDNGAFLFFFGVVLLSFGSWFCSFDCLLYIYLSICYRVVLEILDSFAFPLLFFLLLVACICNIHNIYISLSKIDTS